MERHQRPIRGKIQTSAGEAADITVSRVFELKVAHLDKSQTLTHCADTLRQVERCRAESAEQGLFGAVCLGCTFDQSLGRAEWEVSRELMKTRRGGGRRGGSEYQN